MTKKDTIQKLNEIDQFFLEQLGKGRVYFDIQQSIFDLKGAVRDVENLKEGGDNGKR